MNNQPVLKDERTISVENASYRMGYTIITFGLLAAAAFRSFVYEQETWDLLGLVILGGLATTVYQYIHKTATWRWVYLFMGTAVLAAVVAILFVAFRVTH